MSEPSPSLPGAHRGWVLATAWLCLLPLLLQLPVPLAVIFALAAVLIGSLSWRHTLPAPLRLILVVAMLAAVYWQMGPRPGRDTGCALLAAMLALKASELRTLRDARSLLGFALFAPFGAFLLDQGPTTTALAIFAAISALICMQRLADVESRVGAPPLSTQLRGVGRLIAIGLPLALASFWLFPRLGSPLWGIPDRAIARPGLSDSMSPGEWIDLLADDTPALRVQFFGPTPSPAQRYWRGPVLWDFDGRTWTSPHWHPDSALPQVEHGAVRWDYQIDYEATDRRQLVTLDLPVAAPAGSHLTADLEVVADRPLNRLTRWRMQSSPATRFGQSLSPMERMRALRVPPGLNPRTLALARQWRAQAGRDDQAIVRRALDWIHKEFAYTLDTPLPGRNGVDQFLFDWKAGFCEHFSSAFVVLMRDAGIPARVVTGYVGGVRNPIGGYWVVRRMDAHAWAEVWLDGRGWVRVDPTAAVAPERIYDTLEDRQQQQGGNGFGGDALWQVGNVSDWLRRGWNDFVLAFDASRQQQLLRPFGIDQLEPAQLIALFTTFAVLAMGWMGWLLARGERERDPLMRAWHRMCKRYQRVGLGKEVHETAQKWAQRVDKTFPSPELLSLSRRFADTRYAGSQDTIQLIRDLRLHRPKSGVPK